MKRNTSVSASRLGFFAAFGLALIGALGACKPSAKAVSMDIGGGVMKGEPPMCFQYRGDAAATTYANNIWVHANNTCSYPVDCTVHNDVTEQNHRILLAPFASNSYLLASNTPDKRVDLALECTWKP